MLDSFFYSGAVAGGAMLAVGVIGSAGVRSMAAAGSEPSQAQAVRAPIMIRAAIAEGIGVLATTAAPLLAMGILG